MKSKIRLTTTESAAAVEPEVELEECLRGICAAAGGILSSLAGRPSDLPGIMQTLGLTRTLAWKVLRLARSSDPLAAAEHVPGPDGTDIVIRAAYAAGADAGSVEPFRTATSAFYAMVGRHAASLPELRRLAHGLAASRRDGGGEAYQRQAMEANSQIWGVQAALQYASTFIIDRSTKLDSDRADTAFVRGFIELIRARRNTGYEFLRTFYNSDRLASAMAPAGSRALFPEQSVSDAPLIEAYCSSPLPPIQRREWPDHSQTYELMPGAVGRTGAQTILMGEYVPGFACRRAEEGVREFGSFFRLRTPVQSAVFELFVQRSMYREIDVTSRVFDLLRATFPYPNGYGIEPPILEVEMQQTAWERADQILPVLDVPGYAGLMRDVWKKIDVLPGDFRAWRVRVKYPPIPSAILMEFDLPAETSAT